MRLRNATPDLKRAVFGYYMAKCFFLDFMAKWGRLGGPFMAEMCRFCIGRYVVIVQMARIPPQCQMGGFLRYYAAYNSE